MLCNYVYRLQSGEKFGCFQCDTEDFKKFFHNVKSDLMWVKVDLNDVGWIWSCNIGRWFKVSKSSESDYKSKGIKWL